MANNDYIPNRQDIIWIDFDPSAGKEINKRRPAVVISRRNYSRLTNLVVVAPITHATRNKLVNTDFLVPVLNVDGVDGYVNPLQFFTFDYRARHATYITQMSDMLYAQVQQTVSHIIE